MKRLISLCMAALIALANILNSSILAFAAEMTTFTAIINVYNEETNEPAEGIDVKFVEYDADLPTYPEPQANVVRIIAEWNTSDYSSNRIPAIEFVKGHFYAVQIDSIPEGYCYSWADNVITGIHGNGTLSGDVTYNIALQPHDPLPEIEFPLDIDHEFTFSIVDKSTNEIVEGLDVELSKMEMDTETVNNFKYAETLDKWNTGDDSVHSITFSLHYDTENAQSYIWGMKINNLPDGYKYEQDLFDGYVLCASYDAFDYKNDLYFKNEKTDCVVYIYPEDYNPVYTTTMSSESTTTTTTATTAAATVPSSPSTTTTSTSPDTAESSSTTTTTTTNTITTTTETDPIVNPLEKGNVNGDEKIDISDSAMALMIYANAAAGMDISGYTEEQLKAADVDEDGKITISDATYILTFYAQTAAGMNPSWESILTK